MSATPPPQAPHLVSLKVLRCVRPSLARAPIHDSSSLLDKPGRALNDGMEGLLALPASFGTLYLGETFNAILSLSNDLVLSIPSSSALSPTLKVEIHSSFSQSSTPGTRQHLLTTTLPPDRPQQALNPGESFETLVGCELKELGIHALVATVSYGVRVEEGSDEVVQRNFRKIYKFQVNNPLSVRTKAHSPSVSLLASCSNRPSPLHLEIQITNQTIGSMHFSQLAFNPLPEWELVEAITPSTGGPGVEDSLEPGDTRQFLFRLRKKPGAEEDEGLPGTNQALGRLEIAWTTPNGETGRLTTSLLGRKIPQNSSTSSLISTGQSVSVKTASTNLKTVGSLASTSTLKLEEPFAITFRAHLSEGTLKMPTLFAQYLTTSRDIDPIPPVAPPVEQIDIERSRTSTSTPRQSFDSRPVSPLPPPPPPVPSISATSKGLPPPFSSRPTPNPSSSVLLLGPSVVRLTPLSGEGSEAAKARGDDYEFSVSFIPVSSGRIALGGLRLLIEEGEGTGDGHGQGTEARGLSTIQEWMSIGEVWVS